MPRADISMTPEEARTFLAEGRTMTVVTIGPDGMPDPVGMWYLVNDAGEPVMRTYAKSQKARNLERDPRYSALVETGDTYNTLRGLQLSGVIELNRDPEVVLDIVEGLNDKYALAGGATIDRSLMADYASKQVAMTLHVDKVVSWDHRKL
jgi:PPOX class probable F420-dependent enzyme